MSLLSEAYEPCIIINKIYRSDGYGSVKPIWTDGPEIQAAIVLDNSMQARRAEQEGVTALYTITTSRDINLRFHDVLRRVSDGKVFRVTSDGDDKKTPMSAALDMRQVSAEKWTLPSE